jgi:hypothetical protein
VNFFKPERANKIKFVPAVSKVQFFFEIFTKKERSLAQATSNQSSTLSGAREQKQLLKHKRRLPEVIFSNP